MSQKVVIPRGLVDPGETTVIDIPEKSRGSNVLVATRSATPESSPRGQGSFYTPPQRGYEHPSLDYPAYMDPSPPLSSFYSVLKTGENWKSEWGPLPPGRSHTARDKEMNRPRGMQLPPGAPALPVDFWSPAKRSTPIYKTNYSPYSLFTPPKAGHDEILAGAVSNTPTIRPCPPRPFPEYLPDPDSPISASSQEDPEEAEKMKALDQMDFVEKQQLSEDLKTFHEARRKLVYDLANISATSQQKKNCLLAPLRALKAVKKLKGKVSKNKVQPQ